ncbi:MAG TPA: hypothetical protein VFL92_01315 [Sphingomonas sp.]|nr:hypothetical protein [Sphingomonas sp.]
MKFAKTKALGLVLALGFAGAQPALAKKHDDKKADAPKMDFSAAFRKAAQPLQKAVQAKDWASAKAALPDAQAAASTPDDKYQLALMTLIIAQGTNDVATERTAADAVINSGKAPPEQLAQILDMKGRLDYNAGDMAGADAAFSRLIQLQPNNSDAIELLAAVKTREGKTAEALPLIDQAIQSTTAAGKKPDEDLVRRALSIAYDAKNPAETVKYGQLLAADYPSPQIWRIALQTYRDTNRLNEQTNLDTMRLMRAAHALAGEQDYYEYANLVSQRGYPGEAKAVIDEGMASNQVDDKSVKTSKVLAEIRAAAGSKVAADKAVLPAQTKKAMAAADGTLALNTGDAYLGYGEYAQAVPLYQAALTKSGADANVVNLHLGMALALSHQTQAADQAFAKVTGPNATLAKYWTIWNDQQGGAAPAAAPAATPQPASTPGA